MFSDWLRIYLNLWSVFSPLIHLHTNIYQHSWKWSLINPYHYVDVYVLCIYARAINNGEEEDGQGMWNKKLILWELENWELLNVCHSIDTMHIKKNVFESMCGTLLQ